MPTCLFFGEQRRQVATQRSLKRYFRRRLACLLLALPIFRSTLQSTVEEAAVLGGGRGLAVVAEQQGFAGRLSPTCSLTLSLSQAGISQASLHLSTKH